MPDGEVGAFLRFFTVLGREEIEALEAAQRAAPHERSAQRTLARHMTERLHGESERHRVEAAAEALFGRGDVRALDAATLAEVARRDSAYAARRRRARGCRGLAASTCCPRRRSPASRREAREFLGSGAVSVNGERAAADRRSTREDLLAGRLVLLATRQAPVARVAVDLGEERRPRRGLSMPPTRRLLTPRGLLRIVRLPLGTSGLERIQIRTVLELQLLA